jgi:hypothetical protein
MLGLAGVAVTVAGTPGLAVATTAPTAAAAPATGVTDGQVITVSASGLPANRTIQVEECAGTVADPPTDNGSCDGVTLDSSTETDDQGAYANTGYTVYMRPSSLLSSPATITCDSSHPCVLYVGVDQNNFSAAHAFAALTFSSAATTTTTSATTTTTGSGSSTTSSTTASSSTTTTAHGATTTTTRHGATTTTTRQGGTTSSTKYETPRPKVSTTTTVTTGTTGVTGLLLGGATTTTTAAGQAGTTPTTSSPGLHDSGGGAPGLGDAGSGGGSTTNPLDPAPALALTGGPHAAGLLLLGGLAVALGGSELRRRALRTQTDDAR